MSTINCAIYYAAKEGRLEIVKLCKEKGATDFNRAMCSAAENGHIEIVKLCKKWGRGGECNTLQQCYVCCS